MTDTVDVVRVRLGLSYDGTDFSGWAIQPGLRTVQGELEAALARMTPPGTAPRLTVAGRTDAGVHATGQVAHVDLPADVFARLPGRSERSAEQALMDKCESMLAADLRVTTAEVVDSTFDARFGAVWRRYVYRISDDPSTRAPLQRDVYWHSRAVDEERLNEASQSLTGLRDFAPFCKAREGATTIRDLGEFSWRRSGGLLEGTVRADAFCHSMVRSIVGAVLPVADGRRDLSWLTALAGGARRSAAVSVAPARGLTLAEVAYPPKEDWAARAEATRAKRSLD